MHNMRGNYSVLPGTGSSWQESCPQGWKEFSREFTTEARWRKKELAVWICHPRTDRTCVCLHFPYPGGSEEEAASEEEALAVMGRDRAASAGSSAGILHGCPCQHDEVLRPDVPLEKPASWGMEKKDDMFNASLGYAVKKKKEKKKDGKIDMRY